MERKSQKEEAATFFSFVCVSVHMCGCMGLSNISHATAAACSYSTK